MQILPWVGIKSTEPIAPNWPHSRVTFSELFMYTKQPTAGFTKNSWNLQLSPTLCIPVVKVFAQPSTFETQGLFKLRYLLICDYQNLDYLWGIKTIKILILNPDFLLCCCSFLKGESEKQTHLCRTIELSDYRAVGLSGCPTNRLSDYNYMLTYSITFNKMFTDNLQTL